MWGNWWLDLGWNIIIAGIIIIPESVIINMACDWWLEHHRDESK